MHLHLEGPTGPHIQMELPPASDTEFEPMISDPTLSDNDPDEPDSGVQTNTAKNAYVN